MDKRLKILIVIIAIIVLQDAAIVIGLASALAAIIFNWVRSRIEDR